MTDVVAALDHHSRYMLDTGKRLMNLGNIDISEFRDIGVERFVKLSNILHQVWMEGLELTSSATKY